MENINTIQIKKGKCTNCSKKCKGISTTCKSCSSNFCLNCIQHEVHRCSKIDEYKKNLITKLNNKLESERTTAIKIAVI